MLTIEKSARLLITIVPIQTTESVICWKNSLHLDRTTENLSRTKSYSQMDSFLKWLAWRCQIKSKMLCEILDSHLSLRHPRDFKL